MIDLLLYPATFVSLLVGLAAAVPIAARWLRVAQREHYVASNVTRIAWLWVSREPITAVLLVLAIGSTTAAVLSGVPPLGPYWALVAIVLLAALPFGLPVRGRTAKFAVTARVKRLMVCWITLHVGALLVLVWLLDFGAAAAPAIVLLLSAPLTDLALAIMAPIEKAASQRFVVQAQQRLKQSGARVVAITGSYGKTSTKNYAAHLLSGAFTTVASPASFNNRLGLSRAVNSTLVPGTEVFVAEMGMAAPGQIAELCRQFPPAIAAITVVGEGHLQRMRTHDAVFREKASITDTAPIVVLPIDDPRLAELAEQCRAKGKTVITTSCQAGTDADIVLAPSGADDDAVDAALWSIRLGAVAEPVPVSISGTGHAVNVAVAAGLALAAGVPAATIAARLGALPGSQHRAEVQQAPSGALVIDDTYNANPLGAARALEGAAALASERGAPLVVVTPGMVELGPVQLERNHAFGEQIGRAGAHLIAVARTNRAALTAGWRAGVSAASSGDATLIETRTRDAAVVHAVRIAGDRGVILYENDLPDHYP